MAREIINKVSIAVDDIKTFEDFMQFWDDIAEEYGYSGEYNFIDEGNYGSSELLTVPSTIGEQELTYNIDFYYKGSTDSEYLAHAEGEKPLTQLSEMLPAAEASRGYSGRLCASLNIERRIGIGFYGEMEDTPGKKFAFVQAISGSTGLSLYWRDGLDTVSTDFDFLTDEGTVRRTDASIVQTTIHALDPIRETWSGNDMYTDCNNQQLEHLGFIFEINIPIFLTDGDCEYYCATGDSSKSINNPGNESDEFWYIINKIYKTGNKTTLYRKYGYKWDIGRSKICLYKNKIATGSYNLLLKSNATEINQLLYDFDKDVWDEDWRAVDDFPNYKYLMGDADPWNGDLRTNIPILDSLEDAEKYLRGEKVPIIKKPGTPNPTGSELDSTHLNNASYASFFTSFYILATQQLENIAFWLFDNNNIKLLTEDNPQLWGNNPIEMIIDSYWTPLDVYSLCYAEPCEVVFGQVGTGLHYQRASHLVTPETVLFNQSILGTYGDWRDYQYLSFKLFLPYYGLVELDTGTILKHTLKCTFKYYIASKTIKYYLYLDGVQIGTYEGSLGCSFAISAIDFIGKVNEKFDGLFGGLSSAGQIAGSIGDFATGNIGAGVSNLTSGISSYTKSLQNIVKSAKVQITGDISVDASSNDCRTAYLIIEEDLHIIPDKLNQVYNYSCYIVDRLGNYNGLVMAENIIISSDLTEQEINEIISLASTGIIL